MSAYIQLLTTTFHQTTDNCPVNQIGHGRLLSEKVCDSLTHLGMTPLN